MSRRSSRLRPGWNLMPQNYETFQIPGSGPRCLRLRIDCFYHSDSKKPNEPKPRPFVIVCETEIRPLEDAMMDVDDEQEEQDADGDGERAEGGGGRRRPKVHHRRVADAWTKPFFDICAKLAPTLKPEDDEITIRSQLREQGLPVATAGEYVDKITLPLVKHERVTFGCKGGESPEKGLIFAHTHGTGNFVQRYVNVEQMNVPESSYYPNLNVRVFECLDSLRNSQSPPPELEMWEALLDDLRETGSPEKLQMAKILLLVWVDAWKRAALRAVGPPDWSRVTREYDKLLIEGADGHLVTICTFQASYRDKHKTIYRPQSSETAIFILRVNTRGRPIRKYKVTMRKKVWEAQGYGDARYNIDMRDFANDAAELVGFFNETGDVSFDTAVARFKALIPAVWKEYEKENGGYHGERPKRWIVLWALQHRIRTAVATRGPAKERAELDHVKAALELYQRCVKLEKGVHVLRSEWFDGVVQTFPFKAVTQDQYIDEWSSKYELIASIDHEFQTVPKIIDNKFLRSWNVVTNLKASSRDENYCKHRYPPSVFLPASLFFAHSQRYGEWNELDNTEDHAIVLQCLSTNILVTYRAWDMVCERDERLWTPLHVLYGSRKALEEVMDIYGGDFARPTTRVDDDLDPKGELDEEDVEQFLEESRKTFARKVTDILKLPPGSELDPLDQSTIDFALNSGLISRTQLKAKFVDVRSPELEYSMPSDGAVQDVLTVGKKLNKEYAQIGFCFPQNADEIPSVTLHHLETAQDIARDFARTSMTQSAAEIYAHHLHTCAYNFTGKLYAELIRGVPTDRLRTIYVTSASNASVPLEVPATVKSTLKPSSSRYDHGATPYKTGCRDSQDLSFRSWDPSRATFAQDAWILNSFMRGSRFDGMMQIDKLKKDVGAWATHGNGKEPALQAGIHPLDPFQARQTTLRIARALEESVPGILSEDKIGGPVRKVLELHRAALPQDVDFPFNDLVSKFKSGAPVHGDKPNQPALPNFNSSGFRLPPLPALP